MSAEEGRNDINTQKKKYDIKMRKGKILTTISLIMLTFSFVISITPTILANPSGPIFWDQKVLMEDGVGLYTRIFLPDPDIWGPGPYPTIVETSPYSIGTPTWEGGVSPDPSDLSQWPHQPLMGYAYVIQNHRGMRFSEGNWSRRPDGPDGAWTVEWAAMQPWSNGKVGMSGASALGNALYAAAAEQPPHLVAILPSISSANILHDFTLEGGAIELETVLMWIVGQAFGISESHKTSLGLPSSVVNGMLYYLYAYVYSDLGSHLDYIEPNRPVDSYWWMNLPLMNYPYLSTLIPYWNTMLESSVRNVDTEYYNFQDTIDVPALHVGGWNDVFSRGTLEAFMGLQDRGVENQKLIMTPGTHPTVWTYVPSDLYYRWFNYWLKGIDTGIMDEPPVMYYNMGTDEWSFADQWPPSGIEYTTYYMHDDGTLNTDFPSDDEAPISYLYDPNDPVPTIGGRNLIIDAGPLNQSLAEPPYRDDVLVYTSEVLNEDIEVTGPVEVVLHASSDCPDTDFTAKLIDVHPDGSTMLVFDGVIRARFRESFWYETFMDVGTVYEFTIDLGDISQVFKAGHKIQVDISSSNFPRRDRNPNTGNPLYTDLLSDIVVAENTIFHDADNPSYIILPIMSPEPKIFEGCAKIKIPGIGYTGTAEFYTLEKAVYLKFDDQWIKWDIDRHYNLFNVDIYKCKGEFGKLNAVVTHSRRGYHAVASGRKILFISKFL